MDSESGHRAKVIPLRAENYAIPTKPRLRIPRRKQWKPRKYLLKAEIDAILATSPTVDRVAFTLAYIHAMRISEVLALTWESINWSENTITFRRLKRSLGSTHMLTGPERRLLHQWKREQEPKTVWIISNADGAPMGVRTLQHHFERASKRAQLGFIASFHALKHSCGYAMASQQTDLLAIKSHMGHKSIASTMEYLEFRPSDSTLKIRW